uniref:Zinc finger (CCCH type) motif-containing protein n=1 Tax=Toxoplasma gondii COUG TaxID=1074873 RepID=A0A2G8Y5S5_TOXGO|nr:zinc finger (CCCH type) motif-containing protein [Toxoplasma gondii COUG]
MAKIQGHGRILEALLASTDSPVAAAQSLLDSAVAAGRTYDAVSSGRSMHLSAPFDQTPASVVKADDDDGLAFLVSLLGLDGQGSEGEERASGASELVGREAVEASVSGDGGLEHGTVGEENTLIDCGAADVIASAAEVTPNMPSGVTVDFGFEQGLGWSMGDSPTYRRNEPVVTNTGGSDSVDGVDCDEKLSRGNETHSLKTSGGSGCSSGMCRTDFLRTGGGTQEDGGCTVGERRRRSGAQSIQGRHGSGNRGDQTGLQGSSNNGNTACGAGFLPSVLLSDSALALQTALVALLQLQKQDEEGVKQEPVIPRRNLMCTAFLKTGACNNPERCNYAHNMVELQKKLELRKTSLCKYWLKGKCENDDCNFAHGEHELQSTEGVYKTTICKYWKQGTCHSGSSCRHAHGEADLRPEKLPPHLERKRNHKMKQQWKTGSGNAPIGPSPSAAASVGARGKQQSAHQVAPIRMPCRQDYTFDCNRIEQSFEKTSLMLQGKRRRGADTAFGLDSGNEFLQRGCRNCPDEFMRNNYLPPGERTYEPSMVRASGQTGVSDRLEGYPSSRGSVFNAGASGVRPGQYEVPCGRAVWGNLTVGGRASDEISDMSTASATSSRWGGADCRSSLPSFQDFTRENSGGSESLLRFSNSSITRVSSLAEEESCHGTTWRPGGVAPASGFSDVSPVAASLPSVAHALNGPSGGGGLIFVPPPGLSLHNDFGCFAGGRGTSHTAAALQNEEETVVDAYPGELSYCRYPYVSDAVLRTLTDSVAGLAVDENMADREKTVNDYLSSGIGRATVSSLRVDKIEATGEDVYGHVATGTLSRKSSSSRVDDDNRTKSKGEASGTGVRIVSVTQV